MLREEQSKEKRRESRESKKRREKGTKKMKTRRSEVRAETHRTRIFWRSPSTRRCGRRDHHVVPATTATTALAMLDSSGNNRVLLPWRK
jgi:hypothetical protein